MAIVKGTTVCDESMTGESMPIQKCPIPERSAAVYDPEKGSKKHTLFAGTHVVCIFCFDKTGTLTKHGLDFLGVQPVNNSRFTPIVNDVKDAPSSEELLYALTTCHSVDSLDDRLVGNEREVRMFTATDWELVEKEGEQPYVKS
ncbi:Cation-transporting ATPase [Phytophthora palmivora]|uniref:Cation-transporting ATPase n=1 Tax=Phytophthora palmivora TaxID=4796 RepID=A0A2P4X614_9STRA|nr:Cation-transporting ATPase [Phytophthora palmivora]